MSQDQPPSSPDADDGRPAQRAGDVRRASEAEDAGDAGDAGEQLVLTSPEQASTPKEFVLWGSVILLAVLTAYSPALHGEFIWDDDRHVALNRNLRDFDGLVNIWTKLGLRSGGTVQYYPLTHTTFWLEYQLSGAEPGQINTTIFHVVNAILHSAAAVAMWFVLRQLNVRGAWVAAAVFALHPVNVESVAWISERKNVLAGVFFFTSLLAYLRAEERGDASKPDSSLWALALGLFVLGLFSKTIVCVMPAVVLVLAWWKRGRIGLRDVLWTLPFVIVALPLALLTSHLEVTQVGAAGPEWELSFAQRILIAGHAIWFYVAKLLWPANLTFIYPKWQVEPGQAMQWLAPIAVIIVLAALFALRRRIGRAPLVAALIFIGVLVPALGFFNVYPMRYSYVADHFQYLAAPALIALIVAGAARLLDRRPIPALAYGLPMVLLLALATTTLLRSRVFASHVALWADTERKNPSSWMVQNNLGQALFVEAQRLLPDQAEERAAMLDQAAAHLRRATELKPDHANAHATWAKVLLLQNRPAEALAQLDRALAIDAKNVEWWLLRGNVLETLERPDEAALSYRRGVAEANAVRGQGIWPRTTVAPLHQRLAAIAQAKGDLETARRELEQALVVLPTSAVIHTELARVLTKLGDRARAASHLADAIRLQPELLDPHLDLAELRLQVGAVEGAYAEWRVAGTIANTFPERVTAEQAQRMMSIFQRWQAATQPSTTQPATRAATAPAATAPATTQATS